MTQRGTILVAEDEGLARRTLVELLQEEGYHVYEAADGTAALKILDEVDVDIVLSDVEMPGADGIAVLKKTRETHPQTMVILMTAYASIKTVVDALRLGAQDYLLKPLLLEDVLNKVRRLMEHKQQAWEVQLLRRENNRHIDFDSLVGRSPTMKELFELIKKVAPTNATVLITGESGVGKEVVARLVHALSLQKNHVFLPINSSAIPESLLESQLFGYVKGRLRERSGIKKDCFNARAAAPSSSMKWASCR